jgi:uncharacterized protein YjiS (DUF1127 family)
MMNIATTYTPGVENKQPISTTKGVKKHSLMRSFPLISEWERRVLYRKDLRRLLYSGPHLVRDIGLGIDEALYEVSKPFYIK